MLGYLTHRVARELGRRRAPAGPRRAASRRSSTRSALAGTRSPTRWRASSSGAEDDVRALREARPTRRASPSSSASAASGGLRDAPFASLTDAEIDDVRRAVRRFAERLRGGARVRARRARRGRIDPASHAPARAAHRGRPLRPRARARRRRDRPKLIAPLRRQRLGPRRRRLPARVHVRRAGALRPRAELRLRERPRRDHRSSSSASPSESRIERAWRGGVVRAGDNSNYGRVLRAFESRTCASSIARRPSSSSATGARTTTTPPPRCSTASGHAPVPSSGSAPSRAASWATGDSAMARYAPQCTAVHEVRCARELERAARRLVTRA